MAEADDSVPRSDREQQEVIRRTASLNRSTYELVHKIGQTERRSAAAQLGFFVEEGVRRWVAENGVPVNEPESGENS